MLQPGQVVGKYVVEALIGEGGLARVYRVRHETLGSAHALKLLALRGRSVHRRMVREGRIQATLDHPHVVSVTDVIEHEGQPGLVMEYVEGVSLDHFLGQHGALPIDLVLGLMAQVFGAMAAAHGRGVLHRDLKPANILLQTTPGGLRALVTDFGIARLTADGAAGDTLQGDFLGTPGYMAPEQVSDPTAVDARADVYSLGALAYCLVCGRPPFLPSSSLIDTLTAADQEDFPPVLSIRGDCPPEVAGGIEQALAADPQRRPASVRDMAEQLCGQNPDWMRVVDGAPGLVSVDVELLPAPSNTGPISMAPATGPQARPQTPRSFALRPGATAVPEADTGPVPTPGDSTTWSGAASTIDTSFHDDEDDHAPLATPTAAPRAEDQQALSVGKTGWIVAGLLAAVALFGVWKMSNGEKPTAPPRPVTVEARPAPPPPAPPPITPVNPPPDKPVDTTEAPVASEDLPSPTTPPPDATTPAPKPARPAPPPTTSVPKAEETAPSETTPPTSTSPEDATADASVEREVEVEVEAPPPPRPPPAQVPTVTGTWSGKFASRPFTLRLTHQEGGHIEGTLEVLEGQANWRTISVTGDIQASGSLLVTGADGSWAVAAKVNGSQMTGTLRPEGSRRSSPMNAQLQ